MRPERLLARLTAGALNNVAFSDMRTLMEAFGFILLRVRGSHHVYAHPRIPEMLNLQDANGEAKPYQVRQLLRLVEVYGLTLEEEG